MGGATKVRYMCNGCRCVLDFQTSSEKTQLARNDIQLVAQVALITAGCTYSTYVKVLQHVLGIKPVSSRTFMRTIETLHPIVKQMVDEMCEREKQRMKRMDPMMLGSWKKAVTCADGTWMTRGFHSKNATFSIRNYNTGALLYYKHVCQKGSDKIIDEELYKGTSKSAEGYSARELLQTAKQEGLNIAIHWQDADSSSSKSVKDIFPDAKVMICGGHAGRAHLKKLKSLAKKKTFANKFKDTYRKQFPDVDTAKCKCERHAPGCGCLSDTFCQRARNNFSNILSTSEKATEFSERLQALVYHVQDIHKWSGGQCQFHALTVCNCGKCADKNKPQCQGREYHTREVVSCPFHLLVYRIECHIRAKMADQLVDPTLKRGHSNWLESSHNVFIRFRPKHIFLERLHYNVATNLGLLQANQTQEYNQEGPAYHWKVDLLQRLNLPVYDGVREILKKLNCRRKKTLDAIKTTRAVKRRVELKTLRTQEAQERKLWSKLHGEDTYGDEEDLIDEEDVAKGNAIGKKAKRPCNKCGSTTHSRSTHRDCPFNKKPLNTANEPADLQAMDTEQISPTESSADEFSEGSNDSDAAEEYCDLLLSDEELDIDLFEEAITSGCTCGALNRAHKKACPMNSRARYGTERQHSKPLYRPGDYVCLHSTHLKDEHIYCRVVECLAKPAANLYRLSCTNGVLAEIHSETDLTKSSSGPSIPLDKWRTSSRIALRVAQNDPCNLQKCECERPLIDKVTIDLTDLNNSPSKEKTHTETVWISNPLYILHESDHQLISSSSGWLNDKIIHASQQLLAQHFPRTEGLQSPTLEQINGFDTHSGHFVQMVYVRSSHWILVSNLGCEKNTVNVYDTMYSSLPSSTVDTIARLVFCPSSKLVIRMVDVDLQTNSSDCGVLSLAIAFDILSSKAPCVTKYDHKLIRQHLCDCLSECCFSAFPARGERSLADIRYKNTTEVEIFCICRLPEHPGEQWAECESCLGWFHRHCLDIPDSVFGGTDKSWECPTCRNS